MSWWGVLDRVKKIAKNLCLLSGLFLGCQFPVFVSNYQQRLSGHVAELHRLVLQLQQLAEQSGKSWEQYLSKFLASSDPDFHSHGEWMRGVADRALELGQGLQNLSQAPFWMKWYYFGMEGKWEIISGTWDHFSPGLVFSWEGLFYSAIGFGVGWILSFLWLDRRRQYVGVT